MSDPVPANFLEQSYQTFPAAGAEPGTDDRGPSIFGIARGEYSKGTSEADSRFAFAPFLNNASPKIPTIKASVDPASREAARVITIDEEDFPRALSNLGKGPISKVRQHEIVADI